MLTIKKEQNEYVLLDDKSEVLDRFEEVAFLFDGDILLKWGNSQNIQQYWDEIVKKMKSLYSPEECHEKFNLWIYKGKEIPQEHCTRLLDTSDYIRVIAREHPFIMDQLRKK